MTIKQIIAECKRKVAAVDKKLEAHLYLDLTTAIEAKYFHKLADEISENTVVYI